MDKKKDKVELLKNNWPTIVTILLTLAFLLLGIVLLSNSYQLTEAVQEVDYTNCIGAFGNYLCITILDEESTCVCSQSFNVTSDLLGTVKVFYQLDDFKQTDPNYAKSRDNEQLSGILSMNPSADCGDYRFDNTSEGLKPIAPCGAVADSMFADIIELALLRNGEVENVSLLKHGIISQEDKRGFKNPPGDLTTAFQNFTKPKSWKTYVNKLDKDDNNNGFQNEWFIGWMRTDWTLKPGWRIDHSQPGYENGLPQNTYQMTIIYSNPPNRYRGSRKIIFKSQLEGLNMVRYVIGIICLILGLVLGVAYAVFYFYGPANLKARFIRINTSSS